MINSIKNDSLKALLKKNWEVSLQIKKNNNIVISNKNNIFKDKSLKIKEKNKKGKNINIINYVNKVNIFNNVKKGKI